MEYRLAAVLGAGAFGVTYLARDTNLEKDVAIKEYAPGGVAVRTAKGDVIPIAPDQDSLFRWGLDRFVQEARTLAAFSHPHIVRVIRYFEANSTAYMVMEYERGESLQAFVRQRGPIPEQEIRALIAPLLDGLDKVHTAGFLHRDIKPDNIVMRKDGGCVLLDFGSARRPARASDQPLTAVVSPGYAPLEQYSETNEQGPWTDIYALGGVLCFAMTGERPPDSLARLKSDALNLVLEAARQRYSGAFVDAIAWALAWDDAARPRSVAAWRDAVLSTAGPPAIDALDGAAALRRSRLIVPTIDDRTVRINPGKVEPPSATVAIHRTGQSIGMHLVSPRPATNPPASASRDWTWVAKYLGVALLAVVLSAALGSLQLFETTTRVRSRSWLQDLFRGGSGVGRNELTASHVVNAVGYVGAIVVLWLLAKRSAAQLRAAGGGAAALHRFVVPLATLVAVPSAYAALSPLVHPLIDSTLESLYNWVFVVGTIGAGGWFTLMLLRHSDELISSLRQAGGVDGASDDRSPRTSNAPGTRNRSSRQSP
jgi:serine/threonine protein kinase